MGIRGRKTSAIVLASLAALSRSTWGQPTPDRLDLLLAQNLSEAATLHSPLVGDWSGMHPGERVDAPSVSGDRPELEKIFEGRWCIRSTASIDLGDGHPVQRIALFYPPNIEGVYGQPVPPLPVESGAALRNHGCRLARILYLFDSMESAAPLADSIAKRMRGYVGIETAPDGWKTRFWSGPAHSMILLHVAEPESHGQPKHAGPPVVLEEAFDDGYLPIPKVDTKELNPRSGAPWLAGRAAKLAGLPLGPTVDMLALLEPRPGEAMDKPPFYCGRTLVPVLRQWGILAAALPPERQAAALVLEDRVANLISGCSEYATNLDFPSEDARASEVASLRTHLHAMGIETNTSARYGYEYYAGNLLKRAQSLTPSGPAAELVEAAQLEPGCGVSPDADADCTEFERQAERFLALYGKSDWAATVHLLLAQAYAIDAVQQAEEDQYPNPGPATLLKNAQEHYRAWLATGASDHARRLVWDEIWALQAGLRPQLLLPYWMQ